MKVIHTKTYLGDDRVLQLRLPDDTPVGSIDVLVVLEQSRRPVTAEARRSAARSGRGALKDFDISTDQFLAERRDDERRRDAVLGQ